MKKSILLAGLVTGVIATPTLMLTKGSKSSDKASATLVFPQAYAADTSKNPTDTCQTAFQAVIEAAPRLLDFLGEASRKQSSSAYP